MIINEKQVSDSFLLGVLLSISAGCQDAYTYAIRGHIFANAQTGNIVLMSAFIIEKDIHKAFTYFLPLIAFSIGILLAEQIGGNFKKLSSIHWRQIVILIEMIVLFGVGLLPLSYNIMATLFVSFVCALQVQAFRKAGGNIYVTTMCVGNMRSALASVSEYTRTKNKKNLKTAGFYFGIVFSFAFGAALCMFSLKFFHIKTIWISAFLLSISYMLMLRKEK